MSVMPPCTEGPSPLRELALRSRRCRLLEMQSQAITPTIRLDPTTAPTPIPALAPSDRPELPDELSTTEMVVSVGFPAAQYPVPLTWVQCCQLSQQPAPSAHLNCDVVHPSTTGVSNGVLEVDLAETQLPPAMQSAPKGQQLPPRSPGQRYWLVCGQLLPQQPSLGVGDPFKVTVRVQK